MKKTGQIAICSMMAALSMVIMMLTGLIPMAEFALPAIAGILLVPVVTEVGRGAGWLTYGAVSLLSLILAPSKECALYYLLFLGCYPPYEIEAGALPQPGGGMGTEIPDL